MKKIIFILTVVVMAAVVFNGCKKDNTVQPTKQEVTAKDKAITEKVLDFKSKLMWYKENPNAKDGQTLSVDDAVWNTEALLNYTYDEGVGMKNFTTTNDSVVVPTENGQITYANLYTAYTELESILNEQINSNSEKNLVLADVASKNGTDGSTTLVLTSGFGEAEGAVTPPPTNIYYTNAATVIQNNVNATVSVPSGGYYYTNINVIEIHPNRGYSVNGGVSYQSYDFINHQDPTPSDNMYDDIIFKCHMGGWMPNQHSYLSLTEINFYTGRTGGIIQDMFALVPQVQNKNFTGMSAWGDISLSQPEYDIFHVYNLSYANIVITGGDN